MSNPIDLVALYLLVILDWMLDGSLPWILALVRMANYFTVTLMVNVSLWFSAVQPPS